MTHTQQLSELIRELPENIIFSAAEYYRTSSGKLTYNQLYNLPLISYRNTIVKGKDIASAGLLPELTTLCLSNCTVTDEALRALKDSCSIRDLILYKCAFSDKTFEYIAKIPTLSFLMIHSSPVTPKTVIDLNNAENLTVLDLSHTSLNDDLLKSLHFSGKSLFVNNNKEITDTGIKHLQSCRNLKMLNLKNTALTDTSLSTISTFTSLESLEISNTNLTGKEIDYLGKLTSLEELFIDNICFVNPSYAFDTFQNMKQLRVLSMEDTNISDANIPSITTLQHLHRLNIRKTAITLRGVDIITQNMPHCNIHMKKPLETLLHNKNIIAPCS